jgi:hypothetical protein
LKWAYGIMVLVRLYYLFDSEAQTHLLARQRYALQWPNSYNNASGRAVSHLRGHFGGWLEPLIV